MAKSDPDLTLHTGAKGGAALGRTREFLKESDGKDQHNPALPSPWYKNPDGAESVYGKKGAQTVNKGNGENVYVKPVRDGDKCLPTIKPRC